MPTYQEAAAYAGRIEAIRRRQARDTVLSVATPSELQNAVNYRVDLGTTWTGEAVARALGSLTDAALAERLRSDLASVRSQAEISAAMEKFGLGPASNWTVNAGGTAVTDRSLAHLDRDGAVGVSTLRAMNRASRAFWNR